MNGGEEGGDYYISQTCDEQRFAVRKSGFSSAECLCPHFCNWLSLVDKLPNPASRNYFCLLEWGGEKDALPKFCVKPLRRPQPELLD